MFVSCVIHSFSPNIKNLSKEKNEVSKDKTGMIIKEVGSIKKIHNVEDCISEENNVRKYKM